MLYKPNFCCNCGEKIERVDWSLTVSRRFCEACSVENRRYDLAPRIVVASGALALMFGLGSLWGGNSVEHRSPDLSPAAFKSSGDIDEPRKAPEAPERAAPPGSTRTEAPVVPPTAEITSVERRPAEARFFCGALTRKGTPCSRKVKTKGSRCYQHEGRPEAPPIN